MAAELLPLSDGQHQVILVPKATTDLPFFYLTKQNLRLSENINYEGIDIKGRPMRWQVFPNNNPAIGAPGIDANYFLDNPEALHLLSDHGTVMQTRSTLRRSNVTARSGHGFWIAAPPTVDERTKSSAIMLRSSRVKASGYS